MIISLYFVSCIILSVCFGLIFGAISSYNVVKKTSLLGDIMSHAALPGIVYTFLFFQTKNIFFLMLGGTISACISSFIAFYIQKNFYIQKDAASGCLLSLFFSLGIIGTAIIQKKSLIGQSMINNFIFGNFLNFLSQSISFFIIFSICIFTIFFITIKIQETFSFDETFSRILYKNVTIWQFLFLFLTIISIVVGLQAVGILLMSSLVVAPGVTARMLTNSYKNMILISSFTIFLSFFLGIFITFYFQFIPTSPLISLISILFALTSVFIKKLRDK
jgi:manganese/zinc/iron transport system permease protein